MIVSIHQPNYIPWLGFFYKILKSDVFVLLDNVQYTKDSIQNRNKIKSAQGEVLLTVPVLTKGKFAQLTNEVLINNKDDWRKKHWLGIKQNYIKAECFGDYSAFFEEVYKRDWEKLTDLSEYLIVNIAKFLKSEAKIVKASDLRAAGSSTELLIGICKELKADIYLSGRGGKKYMEENLFEKNGIKLEYYDFVHPEYRQLYGDFIPNLSIVDLLLNCGEKSKDVLLGEKI